MKFTAAGFPAAGTKGGIDIAKDTVWSFSRVNGFHSCPYGWYLRYKATSPAERKKLFFSEYGTFMHELLAAYYNGDMTAIQASREYTRSFGDRVLISDPPSEKVLQSYYDAGKQHLEDLPDKPTENVLCTEKKMRFKIGKLKVVGIVDLVVQNGEKYKIVDHKSHALKPRSKSGRPLKTDAELDAYLRQLYLYAQAMHENLFLFSDDLADQYPDALCFNCFRSGVTIEEPFDLSKLKEATDWFQDEVKRIEAESDFEPNIEPFKCKYICDVQDQCEYWKFYVGRGG